MKRKKSGKVYVFFLMLVFVFFAGVPLAHAGWLDFLIPGRKGIEELNPAITLRAPFADEDAVIEEFDPTGNSELAVPLELRHRPNAEITRWVQMTIPPLLTYHTDKYEQEYSEKIKSFNNVGAQEYVAFLQNQSIIKTLKTGRYNVTGIIDLEKDYPIIINEGAVDGRYRWLYQINVMVNFTDKRMRHHSRDNQGESITRKYVLTVQLGRVRGVDNEHGLLVETWGVKEAD